MGKKLGVLTGYLVGKELFADAKVADIECGSWVWYEGKTAVVLDVKYMQLDIGPRYPTAKPSSSGRQRRGFELSDAQWKPMTFDEAQAVAREMREFYPPLVVLSICDPYGTGAWCVEYSKDRENPRDIVEEIWTLKRWGEVKRRAWVKS